MKTTTINCDYCGSSFERYIHEVKRSQKRGLRQYCSTTCAGKARSANRIEPKSNVECALCGKSFYKNRTKQAGSVHGIYFCCREHKDRAQKLGGIEAIMPPHYGTSKNGDAKTYRRVAAEHHPKVCVGCGYSAIPEILEVHHKDRDRSNVDPHNLEWRCGRCHDEHHFLTRTGRWTPSNVPPS